MTTEFFSRIEGLDLTPGSKQAGFVLVLSGEAAVRLRSIKPSERSVSELHAMVANRLANAGVVSKTVQQSCRVVLAEGSAFPLVIMTSSIGGSLGLGGEEVRRLAEPDAHEWVGPVVELTPHNVDTPKDALALLVMAQTWAEWAYSTMLVDDYHAAQAAKANVR